MQTKGLYWALLFKPSRLFKLQESELTPLQKTLPPACMNRDVNAVENELCGSIDISGRIRMLAQEQDKIVIVDAGCGSGAAIEERIRRDQAFLRTSTRRKIELIGIGIDVNPLPELIPAKILQIDPEKGFAYARTAEYPLMSSLRKDDVTVLKTIPDNSVDIIYSIAVLPYVQDTLRALEAAWRVLKPGGVMCFQNAPRLMTNPSFDNIVANTPGGEEFVMQKFHHHWFVMGTKSTKSQFSGFPYEMTSASEVVLERGLFDFRNHFKVGNYERRVK